MEWIREFQAPPARYRIKPFWFWNGDMEEAEIDRQLREMAEKGLGGVFICARQGLKIPYLSRQWFERVRYACQKAAEYGLEAWLYDEYPYPSGMGGGEVTLAHPEAEHKILRHRQILLEHGGRYEENLGWSRILYAKAVPFADGQADFGAAVPLEAEIGNLQTEEIYQTTGLTAYNNKRFFTYRPQHILSGELPEGKWQIEIFLEDALGEFKYYGNFFDPCCKPAVETFVELTHEKYAQFLGEELGKTVFGMFSDEVGMQGGIPWSPQLPEFFKELKGYEIREHLPALYCRDYPDAFRIRYDYYDAMHKLFVGSYHETVSGWCRQHHLEYAAEVPSMRMTTQRNSTIVGGDTAHEKLGRPLEWIYDEYLYRYRSNAKSVSSLTRQLGHSFAMIESFHSVGWTMTLQDAKWMFDRLAANGINFYNVHAFYYTIASIVKHDAPPSQFLQNPYWNYYRLLTDYTGRLSAWITHTEADIRVAVLDPVASLWACAAEPFNGFAHHGSGEDKAVCDRVRGDWVYVCKELLFHQTDYEHLDAEMLDEAKIEEGELRLGRAAYRVLVIPPSQFLEKRAYDTIRSFAAAGGNVLCLGELPREIIDAGATDGSGDPASRQDLWQGFGWNEKDNLRFIEDLHGEPWWDWCQEMAGRLFAIGEDRNLVSSVRYDGKYDYVFLANQGGEKTEVRLDWKKRYGSVSEMSLENGGILDAELQTVRNDAAESGNDACGTGRRQSMEAGSDETTGAGVRAEKENTKQESGNEACGTGRRQGAEADSDETAETGVNLEKKRPGLEASAVVVVLGPYESRLLRFAGSETLAEARENAAADACGAEAGPETGTEPAAEIVPCQNDAEELLLRLPDAMDVRIDGGNILRFERFELSGDRENWYPVQAKPFIEQCADQPLLDAERIRYSSSFGIPKKLSVRYPFTVWYRTEFEVGEEMETLPEDLGLLMDQGAVAGEWNVSINGSVVREADFRPVRINDQNNRLCGIHSLIRRGTNQMEIQVTLTKDSDGVRDPLYLTGSFGVRRDADGRPVMTEMPEKTGLGLHFVEGFPYYSGTFHFRTGMFLEKVPERFRLRLDIGDQCHECLEILVNGTSIGARVFAPYCWQGDGGVWKAGENEIEILYTNTLAPMLDGSYFDYEAHKLVEI